MQNWGYEIDNYCLPTIRAQCTVYDGLIGETCTVVYRNTQLIKVQRSSGETLKFRRDKNQWLNTISAKLLSY